MSADASSFSPSVNDRVNSVTEQPHIDCDRPVAFSAGKAGRSVGKNAQIKVASIRSVHGKRLLASVPLEGLFQTQSTSDVRRPSSGHRPTFEAHNTSSAECHTTNARYSFSSFTRPTLAAESDGISFSSSGEQSSSDRDVLISRPDSDARPGSTVVRQLESAQVRQSSVDSSRCARPSPRNEFGRRRRPPSVVETASTRLPPPVATKPQLPEHACRKTSVFSGERLSVVEKDADVTLCDARQHSVASTCKSQMTPHCSSLAVDSPAVLVTDVTSLKCSRSSPPNKIIVEPFSDNDPKSRYEISTVGPDADSAVCTDVGSFAERLNRLKTYYERPALQLANSKFCTVADTCSYPADAAKRAVSPSEPCLIQQDSLFAHVPHPPTTVPICEINVSAKLSENLTLGSGESAAIDETVLPPPPEFDDCSTVPTSSCLAVAACRSDAVRDSGVDGWTVDDVCEWLDSVGLCQHCASFRMQNVNGAHLETLGRSELIAVGLTDVHDRMKFERALLKIANN